jgi:phosphotransferase system enzyme I (PtsI)
MKVLHGIGASDGIVMGHIVRCKSSSTAAQPRHITDVNAELARLQKAIGQTLNFLETVYKKALKQIGQKDSMIFQTHMVMLQDEDYYGAIQNKIRQEKVDAAYAVQEVGNEFAAQFSIMESAYLSSKQADILDISMRLIQNLTGTKTNLPKHLIKPSIIVAEALKPSEAIQLDRKNVLAVLTRNGSRISHTSILLQTMGIPSVTALADNFSCLKDGMNVIADGTSGTVTLEPDESAQEVCSVKRRKFTAHKRMLQSILHIKIINQNQRMLKIEANIGQPNDALMALEDGADGIGLFRSEALCMGRTTFPDENEQFKIYRNILELMDGRPVTVRTFDIGADKQCPCMRLSYEENPALGYRSIRISLDHKDIFRTQIRALLRASVYGHLQVMFPLIISLEELQAAKAVIAEEKESLRAQRISYDANIKIGTMVETPAAVMLSQELAKECDFFSIGTNDLTQYTLATDRMNSKIAELYNPCHPAVLRMIQMTVKNAHENGIPVGVCGESAANPALTPFFLSIGIDSLSVVPTALLEVRSKCLEFMQKNEPANKHLGT